MDKIEEFFAAAKKICLNETEALECRERLLSGIHEMPVREATNECLTGHMSEMDPSLVKAAQTICLSHDESMRMEENILAFMQKNPVSVRENMQEEPATLWGNIHTLFFARFSPMLAAVLALVLTGGSLSYAAEFSMPGDTLYPLKVHVNEEVQAALALSPQAKMAWATKRAERRIQEAKQLVASGKLTPEKTATLVVAFNAHIADARDDIKVIADKGEKEEADRMSKETETLLHEQAAMLPKDTEIAALRENIEEAANASTSAESTLAMNAALSSSSASSAPRKEASSASSLLHTIFAVNVQQEVHHTNKEDVSGEDISDEHTSTAMQAIHTMGLLTMKKMKSSAAQSSTTSSGSLSSATSLDSSTATSTSLKVDIKSNGKIDVHIDTSLTNDTIAR